MQVLTSVRGAIARGRVHRASALAGVLLLAACASSPPAESAPATPAPPPPAADASGPCRASAAEFARGRAYTDALGAELQAKAGAKALRVIRPGQAVTMDFRDDRLNVELDAGGKVTKVSCG